MMHMLVHVLVSGSVPQASAVCLNSTRSFGELLFMNCLSTLENLQDIVNVTGTPMEDNWFIASTVQMLTSEPEELTFENITSAATIICSLLSSNLLNETIAFSVVATISQLMDFTQSQYSEDSYTAIENSRMTPLKKKILSSFSLAVVLGLSWVIGYFVLYIILSALFCLCNTTQGVHILKKFTLRSF